MEDAVAARQAANRPGLPFARRQRDRFQANISQSLGENWGNLYLTGSITSYWNTAGSRALVQAGYNNFARLGDVNLNYGVAYARQRNDGTGKTEDRVLISLSLALNRNVNAPRMTANLVQASAAGSSHTSGQVSLSGTFGADNQLNYNANLSLVPGADSFGLGAGYRARFASLSASASKGGQFSQFSFGASGGLVVHPGGVTLANQLGDTVGIVEARDAKGAAISSASGIRIDGAGYAVVPYLVPYRLNEVSIDPQGLPIDIELKTTSQQIAPRANSVVMLKFDTVSGQGVMITARFLDGSPVPFGAEVFNATQAAIGLVGQDGRIFLRGIPDAGVLRIKWGDSSDSKCDLNYRLPASNQKNGALLVLESLCRTDNGVSTIAGPTPRIVALPV